MSIDSAHSIYYSMTRPTGMTRETFTDFDVTLPSKTLQKLDDIRGDIPRSRFLLRLVERALKEQEKGEKLVGAHSSVGGPEERQAVATTSPQREEGGSDCSNE